MAWLTLLGPLSILIEPAITEIVAKRRGLCLALGDSTRMQIALAMAIIIRCRRYIVVADDSARR